MPRRTRAVAVSLAGCDFGNSGVSVFAHALLPRLIDVLRATGVRVIVLGTRRERVAAGLEGAAGPTLPASLDRPALSAAFALTVAAPLSRALGARLLYLPCANRRIVAIAGIPVAGTVHDLAQFYVDDKYGKVRQIYVRRFLVPLLRRLSVVTTVSRATADDVVRFAGVSPSRVRVIHNGVTLAPRLGPVASQAARPYLFYPARLEHPGKNHLRLIQAFAASGARATHDLVLSGAEWGAGERIRETAASLGVTDRVRMVGFLEREAFQAMLEDADVVVAAGLREGFGLPAAEAMACGKVVAASNTGSLPEVVGPLAALFDPLDVASIAAALDRAATDSELRARCALEGPTRAALFSWDAAAVATGAALCEVLDAAA